MSEDLRYKFNQMYTKANPWKFDNTIKDISRSATLIDLIKYGHFTKGLDIGCGEGVFTSRVSEYVDSIDAFDISENAIKRAQAKYGNDKIKFYTQDVREFTPNNKYDLIVCLEMLYYLEKIEQKNVLDKISKSLDCSGVFIMSVVVSGKSKYGEYFTFENITNLLNEYFRIVHAFPLIPKSILVSKLFKILSFINTKNMNWYKIFSSIIDPAEAYQSGFVLIKK